MVIVGMPTGPYATGTVLPTRQIMAAANSGKLNPITKA